MTQIDIAEYKSFVHAKHVKAEYRGFDIDPATLPTDLFHWQKEIVKWCVKRGTAAIFAECGLGKTAMQLAWAEQIVKRTGKPVLILTPLSVGPQTCREATKFGIDCPTRIVKDAGHANEGIVVCNYERLDKLDPSVFGGVVLDESSILKSFMGKTKQQLLAAFHDTPYRLACTATPAPNDCLELGNHAQFLGVMDSYEMIARWFQNDLMQAGKYDLKPHAAKDFWTWVASWAVAIDKPSDIGGSDDGYNLPGLRYEYVTVDAPHKKPDDALFGDVDLSATSIHQVKRESAPARARAVADAVNESEDLWIVWCDSNYEADELMPLIPDAIEIRGDMKDVERESRMDAFLTGKTRVLVTKPEIAGFGVNLQHCYNMAFIGLSYSFERFYQAVRRCYRFGQTKEVRCVIVQSDHETAIASNVQGKSHAHELMKSGMVDAMREAQMDEVFGRKKLSDVPAPVYHKDGDWAIAHGDCVEVTRAMESDSVGLSVYSPPFENLYTYSESMADMGNSANSEEFFRHYEYLLRELYRVTIPGRLTAVHCKDLPAYKGRDGAAGLKDFPGKIIAAHERCGWQYHSRITIWKDPVIEMQRTKNHGLLHKILCKDSCNSRQGMADYVVVFRKWVDGIDTFPDPVRRDPDARFSKYIGDGEWKSSGNARTDSINIWQQYASPVWFDIRQTNVLNNYRDAKGEDDTKHICPLQLDVIARCVELWSNPGDLVYSPFGGIGSEPYIAIKMGRRAMCAELKEEYVEQAIVNLNRATREVDEEEASLFIGGNQ